LCGFHVVTCLPRGCRPKPDRRPGVHLKKPG
jgi:hypothetical protein